MLALFMATVAIAFSMRSPTHRVEPATMKITASHPPKKVVKVHEWSDWWEAAVRKFARYPSQIDPGIAGGFRPLRECRECEGFGGHYVRPEDRPAGGSDLSTCDQCRGSGLADAE